MLVANESMRFDVGHFM